MPFYVYAWIATIAFGIVVVLAKFASKYSISNPWLLNFLIQLSLVIFLIPFAIINHSLIPNEWYFLIISSIFNAAWVILYICRYPRLKPWH